MAESAGHWSLIESDPGVFTELIRRFGVRGVQVEELWTIEDGIFENLKPVHGLIFLFKYSQYEEPTNTVVTDPERLKTIYFAKQAIANARATQAVISLLLNCNHCDVWLGPDLCKFKDCSMAFDPQMRGTALSNSQRIRAAHNSVSQANFFDSKTTSKEEDPFHFIGYIPVHGRLYELDSLRDGPIDHGPVAPEQDWLDVVRPIIYRRILTYSDGETDFNLMALVSDRKMVYERQMDELIDVYAAYMKEDEVEDSIRNLQMLMEQEDMKKLKYQQEMARRRHSPRHAGVIFDEELQAGDAVLEPDDLFVNSIVRDTEPGTQPHRESE